MQSCFKIKYLFQPLQLQNIQSQSNQPTVILMTIVHLIEHAEMNVVWIHVIVLARVVVAQFVIQKIIKEFVNVQADSRVAH